MGCRRREQDGKFVTWGFGLLFVAFGTGLTFWVISSPDGSAQTRTRSVRTRLELLHSTSTTTTRTTRTSTKRTSTGTTETTTGTTETTTGTTETTTGSTGTTTGSTGTTTGSTGTTTGSTGTTTTTAALARAVIKQSDFEYLGAFAVPRSACGTTTSFGETGLTFRYVGGELRFFTGAHRYSNDAIYEFSFPGWGTETGGFPLAKVVKDWGTGVYCKAKLDQSLWVHGLYWDEARSRLYYNFASWYNTAGDTPAVAFSTLGTTATPAGPWKSNKAHAQKIRGGCLKIPDWFANAYTGGRDLGIGFGGYYSIWNPGSKGPHLSAVQHPAATTPVGTAMDTMVLVDYPGAGGDTGARSTDTEHFAKRNADYYETMGWSPNPSGGVGYWTGMDEIVGCGTWIDLPDKHGLLYVSTMGHGKIYYTGGDRYAERIYSWWWVYDPKSLADAAQGKIQPWKHSPTAWQMTYSPMPLFPEGKWKITGITFDPATRTLFVLMPYSYKYGVEWFPLIHGYRVKK